MPFMGYFSPKEYGKALDVQRSDMEAKFKDIIHKVSNCGQEGWHAKGHKGTQRHTKGHKGTS